MFALMFSSRLPKVLRLWYVVAPTNSSWSLSRSEKRNTSPWAEPVPGTTITSPAAKSSLKREL